MLDFFLATSLRQIQDLRLEPKISLGGPIYWFLRRYFVHANLNPSDSSFLDLYEHTEVSGYQLVRLKAELNEALDDLSSRQEGFSVLVGWSGGAKNEQTEDWKPLQAAEVKQKIEELLSLANEAQTKGLTLFAMGD